MFSCVPIGTSLVRTIVQEHIGGNTQVASVVSACLILLVVLWIGGLFEALPRVSKLINCIFFPIDCMIDLLFVFSASLQESLWWH